MLPAHEQALVLKMRSCYVVLCVCALLETTGRAITKHRIRAMPNRQNHGTCFQAVTRTPSTCVPQPQFSLPGFQKPLPLALAVRAAVQGGLRG